MDPSAAAAEGALRQLQPHWNRALIAASIAISFLGAFTSTQLMCHARMSLKFTSVFVWSMLGSAIFGFCSIWCLHEVAMLAFELDLPIGIDVPLTVLSSILAVSFTFFAIATDLLWDRWWASRKKPRKRPIDGNNWRKPDHDRNLTQSATPLLQRDQDEDAYAESHEEPFSNSEIPPLPSARDIETNEDNLAAFAHGETEQTSSRSSSSLISAASNTRFAARPTTNGDAVRAAGSGDDLESHPTRSSSDCSWFPRGSGSSSSAPSGLAGVLNVVKRRRSDVPWNPFVRTAHVLYAGFMLANIAKGFIWSLAITSMHYSGILALKIPSGYCRFNPWLVVLSGLISWVVCTVGAILMSQMESHLPQQILFSMIAAAGVAAMHFTGQAATTFYSTQPPSEHRGYPPSLANAVVAIAFVTCIAANVLLAHSATVARNKLAEIVWTRKELWRTIAQKENAEAAARARSEFIASASHEIRTPLHHLQGYSDLLAHTELTDEGRALLNAIQRATKTLSLITNNVLDWSKFERNTEGSYRPVALDIRAVCDSIIVLLPNIGDEAKVELYVVVSPDVPTTLFLDETWIHRILMNLLSNALKFTRQGYILLLIQLKDDNLVAVVRDTGCGLDPAFIPHMWTPFKQGEVRGSARGTGLGLSIIKQLVRRMNGTIQVESTYELMEGIGPERSGTTFSVTLPLQATMERPATPLPAQKQRVAILADVRTRETEGLTASWEAFGFEVSTCANIAELDRETEPRHNSSWTYVWADVDFLCSNPEQYELLLDRKDLLILVPYNTNDSLNGLEGMLSASNFVMLAKPLIWHTLEKRIANSRQRRMTAAPPQALRFAPEVEVLNGNSERAIAADAQRVGTSSRECTILLVEDNAVNQKLGQAMLARLGYNALVAADGLEAVEIVRKHGDTIDAVLMDQSMPRMDGVTATKEIRRLEAEGVLHGRRKIIALTAVVNSEARTEFRDAGADEFLAKPLALGRLRDVLEAFMGAEDWES